MRAVSIAIATGAAALAVGCSGDVADTEPYRALQSERDAFAAEVDIAHDRIAQLEGDAEAAATEAQATIDTLNVELEASQEQVAELEAAAAAAPDDRLRTDFVAFLAASFRLDGMLEESEAACAADAIVDDPIARSTFALLAPGDESLDSLEGALAVARAFESCGIDVNDKGVPGTTSAGIRYGDDPELDALHDACATGDGVACDNLYWSSEAGSEYETFGGTCGNRFGSLAESPESCVGAL